MQPRGSSVGASDEASYGAARTPRSREGAPRRLVLLLACLVAAAVALAGTRSSWFGLARARAAGIELFPYGCRGTEAPELRDVSVSARTRLASELFPLMPERVGRIYESGWITARNLWTDNVPAPSRGSTEPAGYELRWWALDRAGSEDDVVADVVELATPARARAALALAANARCRRDGSVHALTSPAGAVELHWMNPDDAQEWDVILVRGRRLYRISEVPPEYLLERARDEATPRAIACRLPEASCPASAAAYAAGSLATLVSASSAARAPTQAQAQAYAHAVNLRGYELPGYSRLTPEARAEDGSSRGAFVRCAAFPGITHALAAFHSPEFSAGGRRGYELVYSRVAILPTAAQAARLVRNSSSQRAHGCIAHALMDRRSAHRGAAVETQPWRVSGVEVTPLATPTPVSYRGPEAYHASALRVSAQLVHGSRRVRLYDQSFLFADGPAVIELVAESLPHPFPEPSERFLEGMLVGAAQAAMETLQVTSAGRSTTLSSTSPMSRRASRASIRPAPSRAVESAPQATPMRRHWSGARPS